MFVGFAVLRSRYATISGNEMNIDKAVFNVVNAATLSGFQLTVTVDSYKLIGQIAVFLLISGGALVSLICLRFVRFCGASKRDASAVAWPERASCCAGARLWRTTFSATLPSNARLKPRRGGSSCSA